MLFSKKVLENSMFAVTVILSCANGYHNYLASERIFEHGGYEADSRRYPRGTAENMPQTLLQMLGI